VATAEILAGLTGIASDWQALAIAWHVLLGGLVISLVASWRPSIRVLSFLLVTPLLSVSIVAWLSGNPFNGTTFAVLSAILAWTATRVRESRVRIASRGWMILGMALIAFGWVYPHFLHTNSWTTYLYAAPFGLLPCPTLAVVIGMTLLVQRFRSPVWTVALAVAALLYGAIGTFRLGVELDWVLLFAATALVVRRHEPKRSVRAALAERTRPLPGDNFIPTPLATLTHAVTIRRTPDQIWPWLIQMGAGERAGWYSYDLLDNGRKPSANRLISQLQEIAIGTVFPALPGRQDGFGVFDFEPFRWLILGWSTARGETLVTWTFVLEEQGDGATRLIVRARGSRNYRFQGLPPSISKLIARCVHFVMQRKQLLGIAQRVEAMPSVG
jgi:hypothetical protein